jgi:hypothetical protein
VPQAVESRAVGGTHLVGSTSGENHTRNINRGMQVSKLTPEGTDSEGKGEGEGRSATSPWQQPQQQKLTGK